MISALQNLNDFYLKPRDILPFVLVTSFIHHLRLIASKLNQKLEFF